ncbi:MAG: ABC transporter ATP-binding protein [Synergistaceae bacterium]|jgi:ABC-type glutathione transport system ATPase component|nr:ABC transporter ATP-binding protein [Synergistaceae bacterium]
MTTANETKRSITLSDISVTYYGRASEVRAVRNCSLSVGKGDVVGLVGESGSGKSSILMAIPRLLPVGTKVTGSVMCDGEELTGMSERELNVRRWRRVALVPQGAMNSFTPHLSIERHITEALEHHLGISRTAGRARAAELMDIVDLQRGILTRYPHELSGGQKQRAALAVALACDPDFLLADEPTTALDVITQKEVLQTITRIVRERDMGLLLVTHDLPLAAGVCDTLLVMKDGCMVESGPAGDVAANPKHPYTKTLIEAIRYMETESSS